MVEWHRIGSVEELRTRVPFSTRVDRYTVAVEENVRQVKASTGLREAAGELAERALHHWRVLDAHRAEMDKPMEKGGRKAQRLTLESTKASPAQEET